LRRGIGIAQVATPAGAVVPDWKLIAVGELWLSAQFPRRVLGAAVEPGNQTIAYAEAAIGPWLGGAGRSRKDDDQRERTE
jgi:hypothetical protein